MSLINFVSGVANAFDGAREAWTKPKRARERAKSAADAAEARRQTGLDTAQALQDRVVAGRFENQITNEARPTQLQAASDVFNLGEKGKDGDLGRKLQADQNTGAITKDVLGAVGAQKANVIDATAKADVERLEGWGAVPQALQEQIIAPAQAHELALQRNMIGNTPALQAMIGLEREQMAMQKEAFDAGQRPKWLEYAIPAAALASQLLIR